LSDEVAKGFFHAHTYSAHPVGCAAALAALDLLQSDEISERRTAIAKQHLQFVKRMAGNPLVGEVRNKGVILAMDLKVKTNRYGSLRDTLYNYFMKRGVNLRPLGNTIYTLPPYIITDEQLAQIHQVMEDVLEIL